MHIILLLCCTLKGYQKKRYMTAAFLPLCRFWSATRFTKSSAHCCGAISNWQPCSTYRALCSGKLLSSKSWVGLICVFLLLRLIPHSQQVREREVDLSQQGRGQGKWNVGMSEWRAGDVTPTVDHEVSVNVMAVIVIRWNGKMCWGAVISSSLFVTTGRGLMHYQSRKGLTSFKRHQYFISFVVCVL